MSSLYRIPRHILDATFAHFRGCGRGQAECQTLWLSPWDAPETITAVIHPQHRAHAGGFVVDEPWLNDFWQQLAKERLGIRVQIHTHPADAFHSSTDDDYPIIATSGFLSLVIPYFGLGPIGFDSAYLAELQEDGRWQEVPIRHRLVVI